MNDLKIRKYKFKNVRLFKIDTFASDFYFVTRIIYARLAQLMGKVPNYNHPLQKIALTMSKDQVTKEFSQIQTYIFKKN